MGCGELTPIQDFGAAPTLYEVGPVEAPPITTTVVPETPVVLPSPPPTLYPSFYANAPKDILPNLKFPEGFFFGVDTAAYQVEGAVKDEGKGPSMWDWASRQPNAIADNTTGTLYVICLSG